MLMLQLIPCLPKAKSSSPTLVLLTKIHSDVIVLLPGNFSGINDQRKGAKVLAGLFPVLVLLFVLPR